MAHRDSYQAIALAMAVAFFRPPLQGLRFVSGHAFRRAEESVLDAASSRWRTGIVTIAMFPRHRIALVPVRFVFCMSIPRRHAHPSDVVAYHRTFFVTSSICDKRSLLKSTRAAGLFLELLFHYREQGKYLLHEFVIMPDHFHALITVGPNMTIERAVQFIKGGFAFRAGRELGFRAPVWQKGFSEIRIVEEAAFLQTRAYIHANPVKRGLAATPAEYEFSSARSGFELDAPPQWLKPLHETPDFGIAEAMP